MFAATHVLLVVLSSDRQTPASVAAVKMTMTTFNVIQLALMFTYDERTNKDNKH